jgi:hypothetical protein
MEQKINQGSQFAGRLDLLIKLKKLYVKIDEGND